MYIVIAPIQVKEGLKEQFVEEIIADARGSVTNEPGCLRFDIVQDNIERAVMLCENMNGVADMKFHLVDLTRGLEMFDRHQHVLFLAIGQMNLAVRRQNLGHP